MASTDVIDNYPGFDKGIEGFELGEKMRRGAERFGVETVYANVNEAVLTKTPKQLFTKSGVVKARAVIIATGANPKELGLENEKSLTGKGVAYCATCDGMRYKDKTAVVVGGGNSAASEAIYLSKLCRKVFLVHRRDALRASKVYLEPLKGSGVEFIWNSRIAEILHDEKVTGVRIEDVNSGASREIKCEGLFIAIGREPNTGLFSGQVELDGQGYITADETTKTNIQGVFAAGDVRTKPMRQIATAVSDGAVASQYVEEYLMQLRE